MDGQLPNVDERVLVGGLHVDAAHVDHARRHKHNVRQRLAVREAAGRGEAQVEALEAVLDKWVRQLHA